MSYLYSKLPETGVPPHIDTGGRRAISCLEMPVHPNRKTSRTWRMETLPAGINPLLSQGQKADPKHNQRRLPSSPIPGRHHPGIMGED